MTTTTKSPSNGALPAPDTKGPSMTNPNPTPTPGTAVEFEAAKEKIGKLRPGIKEARQRTRPTVETNKRLTTIESKLARHTRELKTLGERFNATTDPDVKSAVSEEIAVLNKRISAFYDDVNLQLVELKKQVEENTEAIEGHTGRLDNHTTRLNGHDSEIHMLNEGQTSLSQRFSTITEFKTPAWTVFVSLVVGFIAGVVWNLQVPAAYTAAKSLQVALIIGIAVAAMVFGLLLAFTGRKTKETTVVNEAQIKVVTTPPAPSTVKTPPASQAEPGVLTDARPK